MRDGCLGGKLVLYGSFVMYRRFSGVSSLSRFSIFGDFLDLFFGFSWRQFEGVFFADFVRDSHMST